MLQRLDEPEEFLRNTHKQIAHMVKIGQIFGADQCSACDHPDRTYLSSCVYYLVTFINSTSFFWQSDPIISCAAKQEYKM